VEIELGVDFVEDRAKDLVEGARSLSRLIRLMRAVQDRAARASAGLAPAPR